MYGWYRSQCEAVWGSGMVSGLSMGARRGRAGHDDLRRGSGVMCVIGGLSEGILWHIQLPTVLKVVVTLKERTSSGLFVF